MNLRGSQEVQFQIEHIDNGTILATLVDHHQPEEDDTGALFYVVAVVFIYGFSIILMIGSVTRKHKKDRKISNYMRDMERVRQIERRQRKFKTRMMIQKPRIKRKLGRSRSLEYPPRYGSHAAVGSGRTHHQAPYYWFEHSPSRYGVPGVIGRQGHEASTYEHRSAQELSDSDSDDQATEHSPLPVSPPDAFFDRGRPKEFTDGARRVGRVRWVEYPGSAYPLLMGSANGAAADGAACRGSGTAGVESQREVLCDVGLLDYDDDAVFYVALGRPCGNPQTLLHPLKEEEEDILELQLNNASTDHTGTATVSDLNDPNSIADVPLVDKKPGVTNSRPSLGTPADPDSCAVDLPMLDPDQDLVVSTPDSSDTSMYPGDDFV